MELSVSGQAEGCVRAARTRGQRMYGSSCNPPALLWCCSSVYETGGMERKRLGILPVLYGWPQSRWVGDGACARLDP